ncbi:MAG: imidazolonepropionase [Candidatus Dormibacteraeota bacterium]|uniref:Imidazolonepropionase n=2 Tax=Candidatus Aeolococcus gillhamiae TaxID=3127015 RepID=A0A934JYG8_9BACT|nr:imidazolonepropionase [Candidatus Dormibacteraeota bacterium]
MRAVPTLIVRNIGALVTCDPRRGDAPGVVHDAVLIAAGGTITYAGPSDGATVPALTADVVDIDAHGAAVIPGFVDAHSHITWLGERSEEYAERARGVSYEEIGRRGGGIGATVRSTAAGTVAEIRHAAAARARRMIECGTTTVEVKSGYGLALDAEMRQLDAAIEVGHEEDLPDVVATYLPLHAPPGGDREALLDEVCRAGVRAAATRASFCDVFCEDGAFTVDECRRVLVAAREAGLGVKVHAEQRSHSGGAQLAAALHAASADHLEHGTDEDFRALAGAAVAAVILPGAALVLGGPPPPGRRLLEAGATVAVATDCNPGSCYSESMPLMVSLAVATAGMTPAQALVAATAGGAAALRLEDRGMLRAGLRCDAVILATPRWLDIGYHLGANLAETVIRAGLVVAGGEPQAAGDDLSEP